MRTLNDITPPSRRKEMESMGRPESASTGGRSRFPFATTIAILVVIAASVGALFYFSSAKVEVTANTVSAAVQGSFTATKSTGDLPFEIITAQKVASESVKSTGTKAVNSSASGTITIYNTQSKAQKLIANTRFATTAGLIFRIHTAVTVPGGTSAKPGSVNAKVYADQGGSTYNVAATSFTIPGFAGTPQESAVYGRSTSPMTGGASGNIPVIDASVESRAKDALTAALAPDLAALLQSQVPSGYVLVPGAATTTFEELEPTQSATAGEADVKEQGTITAIVFPNSALAKAIAISVAGLGYQGEDLTLAPASSLTLAIDSMPGTDESSAIFSLSGTASLIYSVDTSRIAAAVSGKTRSAAETALSSYPEVKRAIIVLRPFWRQTFPQDPSSIAVVVAEPAH